MMIDQQPALGPACHFSGITGYGLWQEGGVCFVGIAPGQDEALKSKKPLTGPSGQLLDSVLDACGWPRSQVYATNILCWWKNDPTLSEVLECWPRLKAELIALKPKLIIPLGVIATDFLLGNVAGNVFNHVQGCDGVKRTRCWCKEWDDYTWSKINAKTSPWKEGEEYFGFTKRRGRTQWSSTFNAYVLPTYHPASVLRGGAYFISDIVRDLSKIPLVIKDFLNDGREAAYQYNVCTSIEDAQQLLRDLPRGVTSDSAGVSLDIETNYGREDIDWFSEDLLCLSLTWGWNRTVVIPGEIAKLLDWSVTAPSLVSEGVHWIGQNFVFDSGGMRRWCKGANLPVREDTMLESYALDERTGKHGLEILGGEWCAAPAWKSDLARYTVDRIVETTNKKGQVRRVHKQVRQVPDDALYRYNAGDTTYTYRSHVRQQRAIIDDDMGWVYSELLVPAANAFKDIQYRGMFIDQHKLDELMVDWCELWLEQEERINKIVHQEDPTMSPDATLNYKSFPQMARFLYEVLGLPKQYKKPSTRGKAEAPKLTTDKDALEALYTFHPFCQELHDLRQTTHQLQVAQGIIDRIKDDQMLHAVPQLHGTETGRLSYKDPNLQNISQDWMVGPRLARIREIFAPRNPETHFIAEADYRQIELYMARKWSDDVNMAADLATGDFHRMTAMGVYHKEWDEVTKGDRFFTKMVTFGRLYERGAEDLTRGKSSLHCSIAEAEIWIREWSKRYSGYVAWTARLKQQVKDDGIIVTPWGRKRRYYLVMGEDAHHQLRSALNFCMQSTAHDYTLSALIKLQPLLAALDTYILIEGHDALMLEVSRKHAPEVFALVTKVMESVRPNEDWPTLFVEWKSGPNWGQCREACKVCHKMYPEVGLPEEFQVSPTVSQLRCPEHRQEMAQLVA